MWPCLIHKPDITYLKGMFLLRPGAPTDGALFTSSRLGRNTYSRSICTICYDGPKKKSVHVFVEYNDYIIIDIIIAVIADIVASTWQLDNY